MSDVENFDGNDSTRSSREMIAAFSQRERAARGHSHRGGRVSLTSLVLVAISLLAACSSSSGDRATPTPSVSLGGSTSPAGVSSTHSFAPPSPTDSGSTTSQSDPAVRQALDAFAHYITASYNAERAPRQVAGSYPAASDFPRYAFDPMLTQENAYIASLAANDQAFRGTPPTPRVRVSQADLDAKPHPTVVLTNCPTPAPTWVAYDTKTGKRVSYAATKVPPPYLSTVTVIFYEGRWGVQKTSVNSEQTCTA